MSYVMGTIRRTIVAAVVGIVPIQALADVAQSGTAGVRQVACAPHDKLVAQLSGRYSEKLVSLGLSASGHVMQVYSANEGQSWTIVSTNPAGLSCILASGNNWQGVKAVSNDPAA